MDEIKGQEKIVIKASRDGLIEENLVTGEEKSVSGKKSYHLGKEIKDTDISEKEKTVINSSKGSQKKKNRARYKAEKEKENNISEGTDEKISISKSAEIKKEAAKKKVARKNTYQKFKVKNEKEAVSRAFKSTADTSINAASDVMIRGNSDNESESSISEDIAEEGAVSGKYVFSNHRIKTMRESKERTDFKQESAYERFSFRENKTNDFSVKSGNPKAEVKKTEGTSKAIQKKRYKRSYAAAKHSGVTVEGSATRGTSEKVRESGNKVKRAIVSFVKNNKVLFLILGALGLIAIFFTTTFSGVGLLGTGVTGTVTSTTYPSEDSTIYAAEATYAGLEASLNTQINNIESEHPGYDEYNYSIDEIGHNPYHLTSYLTCKYGNYDGVDVSSDLNALFASQYTLTLTETTETREREKTDPDTGEVILDANGNPEMEEYEAKILNVSLRNMGFDYVASNNLTSEEYEYYKTLNATYGCRDYLWNTTTTYYAGTTGADYTIPPEALSDERFKNMITEAEKYLGYPYVWGGASPDTSFDCSGFVSWVINNCGNGWSYGRLTTDGLRDITAYVSPEDAKPGDLIFFQGTYNTSGTSHVGIYVGDGMMIHCGDPIKYSSVNSDYWQQHFHSYGRLP